MGKYDTVRKIQRNKALVRYRDSNPDLSWREIGSVFGISTQRAHELYQRDKDKYGAEEQLETV